MAKTFFFYDLETSGINPRDQRIMQFAGQRTDMDLKPVGDPVNVLVKLTPDIMPEPDAILITGITPQKTLEEGYTEAEFLKIFFDEVATADTIFVGYNSIRFDDEFMRFTLYRNFYDSYEWQWQDGRGRWDLLDVVRMTRALRPDGIVWPFAPDGKPSNRLEYMTSVNKLSHESAHDALSDVYATIAVANLIKNNQPKLFDYLLNIRDKKSVSDLVQEGVSFVYCSGKYAGEFEKTTVAVKLCDHPKQQGALVYDLRNDPSEFLNLSAEDLAERWAYTRDENALKRLPIKTLQYNRCPAVAPLKVLDEKSIKRISIDLGATKKHKEILLSDKNFVSKVLKALEILDKKQQQRFFENSNDVDSRLYDGFVGQDDKIKMSAVRAAKAVDININDFNFKDDRLNQMLPLYKARNYPKLLNNDEKKLWQDFCRQRFEYGGEKSRISKFETRILELAARLSNTKNDVYLLEELKLYVESL